jgi:hypothetical protein
MSRSQTIQYESKASSRDKSCIESAMVVGRYGPGRSQSHVFASVAVYSLGEQWKPTVMLGQRYPVDAL